MATYTNRSKDRAKTLDRRFARSLKVQILTSTEVY